MNFASRQAMIDMINFLIENTEYNFYIHSLSFPINEK